jgi:hypothetical protein
MRRLVLAVTVIPALIFSGALYAAGLEGSAARALGILIAELKKEGFVDATVSQRIFGGYVVEAQRENTAVLVSLSANDFSPQMIETFSKDTQSGFFGTVKRPLDGTVQSIITRYTEQLAKAEDTSPDINLTGLLRDHESQPLTAGFTQNRGVSFSENSVLIQQTETLGILSPITTITTINTETQSSERSVSTQSVDHRVTFSTQKSETVIQMMGTNAFNSAIFTSPSSIRDTITQSITIEGIVSPPAGNGVSQAALIDQIVATTEALSGNFPNGLPTGFPANLRENINLILNPGD